MSYYVCFSARKQALWKQTEFSNKYIRHCNKRTPTCHFLYKRTQDATTVPARHMWETLRNEFSVQCKDYNNFPTNIHFKTLYGSIKTECSPAGLVSTRNGRGYIVWLSKEIGFPWKKCLKSAEMFPDFFNQPCTYSHNNKPPFKIKSTNFIFQRY